MKFVLLSVLLFMLNSIQAQEPRELEFNTLPCTSAGTIGSDGKTCTAEDVKNEERRRDKILTSDEKKLEKLSKKKDPLKIQDANKKRSRGTWVRSGSGN